MKLQSFAIDGFLSPDVLKWERDGARLQCRNL